MTAADFREAVGGLVHRNDENGERKLQVENPHVFHEIAANLKVLARATAADKHLLVVGLRNLGKKVAVTGDGINDIEALGFADVGISMGTGVSAAKEASSIVLTEDDFEASLRAVMWGRNIYHNITRFIQFQVTVNLSCLLTVIIGIVLFGRPPLNSVQLLWINLVMDTFAALALASEPPMPSVIQGPPFTEKVSILSPTVWRQILGITLWNTIIMTLVMVFGRLIGGLDSYSRDTPTIYAMPDGFNDRLATPSAEDMKYTASQSKVRHLTYIFNIFICL
jgi:P-type Ca2+ transporter type 2B